MISPYARPARTLVRIAEDGLESGWWDARDYAGMGERQARIADLECGAAEIREYHPSMLPGLLQIEAYARHRGEVALSFGAEFDLEATTRGRLRRQQHLDGPTALYDVILEPQAVLRLPVPADVMADQLRHLLDLMKRPNVRVRVLPARSRRSSQ